MKPKLFMLALVPLGFLGCATTDPKFAFDDVSKQIAGRTGHNVQWMRDDALISEIENAVESLLGNSLTAESAVSIALLNNRSLQAEYESIGISQAELAQASRLRNPEFGGSWRLPLDPPTALNAEYSLAQDFLDLLLLPARKKIAARNLEATKLRVSQEVLKLSTDVQTAFYTLQAHQQFAGRMKAIVEVNEVAADLAKRQHDVGNINDLELHNQEAVYTQSRLDLAKAEAQVRAGREKVNRLLGLWGKQTNWKYAEKLPPLPPKELPLENLEAIAVERRFDLSAARTEVQGVASALQLKTNYRFLPGVRVGMSAEHDLDHSWVLGPTLDFEVPLFDQGQGEVARLSSEYRRAQRNFEAMAVNIRSEIRETRDALITARDAAEYNAKVLLPQRQRILRETLLHYNAMQISNYILLAAKEREQLAEREAIEALKDYWITRVALESALGGPLPNEVASTKKSQSPTKKPKLVEHKEHQHKK